MAGDLDIAAMDAAQKLAFAQATGSVLLSSGSISSPVASFELALPTGYVSFLLELYGFQLDQNDNFGLRFSANAGISFYSGSSDYENDLMWSEGLSGTPAVGGSFANTDNQAWLNYGNQDVTQTTAAFFCTAQIFPGSASLKATTRVRGDIRTTGSHFMSWLYSKLDAAVGRQNMISVGGYFGDGDMLTAGSYRLYGIG
jgi:hypothetical protein